MSKIEQLKKLEEMKNRLASRVRKLKEAQALEKASSFSVLVEGELERAETLLAAKEMVKKLQDMAEDLAKMQTEDLMPLIDTMKTNFSNEAAENFNTEATEQLQSSLTAVKNAKDHISNSILKLEGKISDEDVNSPSNDMADNTGAGEENGAEEPSTVDAGSNPFADEEKKNDEAKPVEDPFAGAEAASGPTEEPLGRAEKRSDLTETKKVAEEEIEKPTLEQFMGQIYTNLGKNLHPYIQLAKKKEADLHDGNKVQEIFNEVFGPENWAKTAAILTILSLVVWDHKDMDLKEPKFKADVARVLQTIGKWGNVRSDGSKYIRAQYIQKYGEPVITSKDMVKAEKHGVKIAPDHHQIVADALGESWKKKMHTSKKNRGMWDDWTVADLKKEQARLHKKENHTAADTKRLERIAFAIRAKKAKGGKWKGVTAESNTQEDVMPVQSPYAVESDHDVYKSFMETNPKAIYELAPPGEKAEHFIMGNKGAFKKRYGKNWERALYATAWKKFGEACMDETWPDSEGLKKETFTTWCKNHGFKGPGIGCTRKAMDSGNKHIRGKAAFYANTVQPKGENLHDIMAEESPVEHYLNDKGPTNAAAVREKAAVKKK
jgi:hypothetical protein